MDIEALREINAERRARRAVVLLTDLGEARSRVIRESDTVEGDLAQPVAEAFRSGRSNAHSIGEKEYFVTAHVPPPRLVVIGAVHISQALAPMGASAGFDVEIIDPRTAFATRDRFPSHAPVAMWPEDALSASPLDPFCALAALTHDPKIDDFALRAALEANCFYVGALGSRKTHAKRLERLAAAGLSDAKLNSIHAPIGLDIGAATPPEIAVAVLAQVISALRGRRREGGTS